MRHTRYIKATNKVSAHPHFSRAGGSSLLESEHEKCWVKPTSLILIIIFAVGASLRFTNLNWDSFQAFHPDERNIAWAVTRIRWFDQMNPKFFAYGGLPIYLYALLSDLTMRITGDPAWSSDWGHIALVGRYVSATLSSVSIYLIYRAGVSFFSPAIGLVAAYLLSFAPWAIREAHFATTETMLVFFLLLLLLLSSRHCERSEAIPLRLPRPLRGLAMTNKLIFLSGIIWGLAMAAKPTSLLFVLIPLVSFARPPLAKLGGLFLAAAGTFLLASPYTILDWQHFRESMQYETGVALGRFRVPYTLQFEGTIPYLYQIKTILWQAGPVPILGIIGLVFFLGNPKRHLSLFLFPMVYFAWSGSWFAKFARYNVPFLPFATIAAAWLLTEIHRKFRRTGLACITCFACLALFWGLANWTIYLRADPRIAASQWIMANAPPDALLLTEHWNDGLSAPYARKLLPVYDSDTDAKMETLSRLLKEADYLVLTTRRIWSTMPKLTTRYPQTSRWYQKLLAGELGYTEVATFTNYPSLFGVTIPDDASEESIQVFDHPTVRIFKKTTASPLNGR